MSFLRTDYSEVKSGGDFSPLPIGEYEAIISKVEVTKSQAGNKMLKIEYTVRDDVDQEGKKRKFFENVVESLTWKFQALAKAAQLPAGQEIASLEEFASLIQYKPVLLKNKHEEYNGQTQDRVHFVNESKIGTGAGSNFGNTQTFVVDDESLPF
jgi:hypothetical protein